MKYIIDIENGENDEFDKFKDNISIIGVYDSEGNEITKSSRVSFWLTQNALLGLGTELIRLAHNFTGGNHFHIEPDAKDVETLGIHLTSDSCELIVGCWYNPDDSEKNFGEIKK